MHPLTSVFELTNEVFMADYKKYKCLDCGYIYDESLGIPDSGIAPGTRWEDLPDDWTCPECGAEKSEFELVE